MLRVLLVITPGPPRQKFGSLFSIQDTQLRLKTDGVMVDVSEERCVVNSGDYDLIHFVGISDSTHVYQQMMEAHQSSIPTIVSPQHWNSIEYEFEQSTSWKNKMNRFLFPDAVALNLFEKEYRKSCREEVVLRQQILEKSHFIIAASQTERAMILGEYRVSDPSKIVVIYPSLQTDPITAVTEELFAEQYRLRDFILCSGDICPQNNQLNILQSLRRALVPIVFLGKVAEGEQEYWRKCCQAASKYSGKIIFIHDADDEKMRLSAMKNARVHVSARWHASFCLDSLEAALCGCNVVITNRSPYKEYFGEAAFDCDPSNHDLLRKTILHAYSDSRFANAADYYQKEIGWSSGVKILADIYHTAANRQGADHACL